jgi:hypothetical protein
MHSIIPVAIVFSHDLIFIFFIYLKITLVDRWFKPRSGQTKDYKIGICSFSAKHTE